MNTTLIRRIATVAAFSAAAATGIALQATPAAADTVGALTVRFDANGDGFDDTTAYDVDRNGVFETMLHDSDRNGDPELWMYDDNQNGLFERYVLDTDNDGAMDVFVTDSNADEVPDAVLVDANTNGMDDREEAAADTLVGPATNLDPVNELMLLLTEATGRPVYGTPDRDHDGYDDNHDARPDDPYSR